MKKLSGLIAIILLAACTLPPTTAPGLKSANTLQTTPAPTATEVLPTATSTTVAVPLTGLVDVHMVSENTGWALAQKSDNTNSLFYTADGGPTWINVTPPNLGKDSLYSATFLDEQTAWVEACSGETYQCKLLRTVNSGKTWTVQNENLPFNFYSSFITFLNEQDGLARRYDVGAGHGVTTVYATHDGGSTWDQVMLSNPAGVPGSLEGGIDTCNICGDVFYYDSSLMLIISGDLASDPGGAVHLSISMDLGKTWKDLSLPLPDKKFAKDLVAPMLPTFFNDKDAVLPVQLVKPDFTHRVTAFYNTHDGGQTWQTSSNVLDDNVNNLSFLSPQEALAICGNTICVTHDGAQTWQTLSTNLKFDPADPDEYVRQFYFTTPSLGWALILYKDSHILWKTMDGGKTWEEIKTVIENR